MSVNPLLDADQITANMRRYGGGGRAVIASDFAPYFVCRYATTRATQLPPLLHRTRAVRVDFLRRGPKLLALALCGATTRHPILACYPEGMAARPCPRCEGKHRV